LGASSSIREGHAYKGLPFPSTEAGARCVLCQQILDPDAKGRLVSLEAFATGGLEQRAKEAQGRLSQLAENFGGIALDSLTFQMDSPGIDDEKEREA
jgi:hypothetical protein